MPTRMVVLVCVIAPLAAPFLRRSASVSACCPLRGSRPFDRLMCFVNGLQHALVEVLLFDCPLWPCSPIPSSSRWLEAVSTSLPWSADVRGCAPPFPDTTLLAGLRSPLLLVAPSTCEAAAHWSSCGRASELRNCHMPHPCREPANMCRLFCPAHSTRLVMLRMRRNTVIDPLIIRDRKIRRLWLQSERANQKPPSAEQFTAIDCSLLLLPPKA